MIVMLHLEGWALNWHYFYTQKHYTYVLKERFGTNVFKDTMMELVILKQLGTVEYFHEQFVSLLNQLLLTESYALNIYISNLTVDISKHL